jgi:hypothetical protein
MHAQDEEPDRADSYKLLWVLAAGGFWHRAVFEHGVTAIEARIKKASAPHAVEARAFSQACVCEAPQPTQTAVG